MIHPLRRIHRATFTVLAVALPTLFVVGIAARAPIPAGALPTAVATETLELGESDHADALVYWSARSVEVGAGLPEDALLLGALRAGRVARRAGDDVPTDGRFVIYSLADQEVVGVVEVDREAR